MLMNLQNHVSLIDYLPLPAFAVDANQQLLRWNRACEVLTGLSAAEIIGTNQYWRGFYGEKHPLLLDLVIEERRSSLRCYHQEDSLRVEGWYRQVNGKDRYLICRAAPVYGENGKMVAAIETVEDISETKQVEESLRNLSRAVEQNASALVITDCGGKIQYANPSLTTLTGYLPDEVVGKHLSVLYAHFPREFRSMWETVTSGAPWRGEFYNKRKNGDLYWESTTISPVKDDQMGITLHMILKEDVTDRGPAQERARHSISALKATLESTADAILVRDLEGRCITYNRNFTQMWNLPEQILETNDERKMRLFVTDQLKEPEKFMELTDRSYRHPERHTEDILELKDGRVFVRVSKPQIVGHQVVGRVISLRDITVQKKAEDALREVAERYRTLVDNIDLGITLMDSDFRIIMTNAAAERLLERQHGRVQQRTCLESCGVWAGCGCCLGKLAMQTGEPAAAQTKWVREDGKTTHLKIKAFPISGAGVGITGFIEVIQDVTEQVQAEKEKVLLESQLRQSQKFEAIGTLAGGIAHDFNNLLTVITAYSSLIAKRLGDDDPSKAHIAKILCVTEKATKLTQGLLAYSRKQELEIRPVDINGILLGVEGMLPRLLGEDVDLRLQLGVGPLVVMADPIQLEQVLMNLVANARDAMPNGGVVEISTCFKVVDSDFIKFHGYGVAGSYALLIVSDTGEGMEPATKERVFEPFFTTKEVGKGTGLGLSVAYGIIKQHNGFINIYSEVGKGSTFRVFLPLSEVPESARRESAAACSGGGSETILLVEDDEEIRAGLKEFLKCEGYTVIDAGDGEDGLRKFEAHGSEISLLLLDVITPKMTGITLYEEVSKKSPSTKAIFMSGYTSDILSSKGTFEGMTNFISKPFTIDALLGKIRSLLD